MQHCVPNNKILDGSIQGPTPMNPPGSTHEVLSKWQCGKPELVIKANVNDLRDNNNMKLYQFKTMTYGKHSKKYVADIPWNSINIDIKNTDYVNVFKRKISNWQGPICQCGKCLICIFKVS